MKKSPITPLLDLPVSLASLRQLEELEAELRSRSANEAAKVAASVEPVEWVFVAPKMAA